MDVKKSKRKKRVAGKRHGRIEEKPKSPEVMNEKEKQDRLEAASALSSLMFLPPKSSNEDDFLENESNKSSKTSPTNVTQFSRMPSTTGNPTTSLETETQNTRGRNVNGLDPQSENNINARNSLIIAKLQSQLSKVLHNKDSERLPTPTFNTGKPKSIEEQTSRSTAQSMPKGLIPTLASNSKFQLPVTVVPPPHTVNKQVAEALRQAVSNNRKNVQSLPLKEEQTTVNSVASSTTNDTSQMKSDEEKMDLDITPSSRLKENTDTKLPLKKRRLVGVDGSVLSSDLNLSSSFLQSSLTSAKQIENILQMAKDYPLSPTKSNTNINLISNLSSTSRQSSGDSYKPVQFDPRTSLMVLSDLKFALTPDEDGDLPIHIAVVHENTELVKKFIDIMAISGKTVDRFNKLQQTPLHLAVLVNKPDIVQVLLEANANPNLLDRHGNTAVHICVNKRFEECLHTVFEHARIEANVNTRDYEGYYPMHTCVELNTQDMMEILVEHGADVNSQDGKAGRSVLLYAVEYSRVDIVEYLLSVGADPDILNYASVSPLMTAQAGNMQGILKHLNKALDMRASDDNFYNNNNKKVPYSRTLSRSSSLIKDEKIGQLPYIAEEAGMYSDEDSAQSRSRTGSFSLHIKRETLSRQISESTPIDLSMKRNTESPSVDWEPTIRGKAGRRKVRKEHKNHKEKLSHKSVVKEKHASVVAALEGKHTIRHPYHRMSNGNIKDEVYNVKREKMNEMGKGDNKENTERETFSLKPSEALNNFYLNILVEKMKAAQRMQLSFNENNLKSETSLAVKALTENEQKQGTSEISELYKEMEKGDTENYENINENNEEESNSRASLENGNRDVSVTGNMDHLTVNELQDKAEHEDMDTSESESMPVLSRFTSLNEKDDEDKSNQEQMDDSANGNDLPAAFERQVTDNGKSASMHEKLSMPNLCSEMDRDSSNNSLTKAEETNNKKSYEEIVKNLQKERVSIHQQSNIGSDNEQDIVSNSETILPDESSPESSQSSRGFELADKMKVYKPVTENSNDSMEIYVTNLNQMKEIYTTKESMPFSSVSLTQPVNVVCESKTEIETHENEENNLVIDEDASVEEKSVTHKNNGKNKIVYNKKKNKSTKGQINETTNGSSIEKSLQKRKQNEPTSSDKPLDKFSESLDENLDTAVPNGFRTIPVISSAQLEKRIEIKPDKSVSTMQTSNSVDSHFSIALREKAKDVKSAEAKMSGSILGEASAKESISASKQAIREALETLKLQKASIIKPGKTSSLEIPEHIKSGLAVSKTTDAAVSNLTVTNVTGTLKIKSPMNETTFSVTRPVVQNTTETLAIRPSTSESRTVSTQQSAGEAKNAGQLLKQGQSHTLFYHDGDGFKPVKIFIDNSEQSSLVLQRMFQPAQMSNLKRQTGAIDTLKNLVPPNITGIRPSVAGLKTSQQNTSLANISSPCVTDGAAPATLSSQKVQTVSVTGVRPSVFPVSDVATVKNKLSMNNEIEKNKIPVVSANSVVTDGFKMKAALAVVKSGPKVLTKITPESAEHSESTPANVTTLKKSVTFMNKSSGLVTGAKMTSSEGTLTRINPDVKSRLSRALQSPHRKLVLLHSDSDSSVTSSSITSSEPVVTETRQLL